LEVSKKEVTSVSDRPNSLYFKLFHLSKDFLTVLNRDYFISFDGKAVYEENLKLQLKVY
jgi:hypothetical protein